jgi:hypothetical protein
MVSDLARDVEPSPQSGKILFLSHIGTRKTAPGFRQQPIRKEADEYVE